MKNLVVLFFILFFPQVCFADMVLQGVAEYNVQTALDEVSECVKYTINPKNFYPQMVDINREENLLTLLSGKVEIKDRELALFSNNTYGVVYKNNPFYAYYYSNVGVLEFVDIRTGMAYPYKSYQYDIRGNLVNMGLRLSKVETYLYSPSGKLIAHWVGKNGYDEMGNIIMTRQFFE